MHHAQQQKMIKGLGRRFDMAFLSPVAREVRERRLTYLSPAKLRLLESTLREVCYSGIRGDFLEFGVALGGSAIIISTYAGDSRIFHGYDVFGMIPPPSPEDDNKAHARYQEIRSGKSRGINGDLYYGYIGDLYDRVCRSMAEFNRPVDGRRVALHPGPFEETVDFTNPRPVAFAHIDCDWYDPVLYCLAAIRHRLAPGGRVILDDYNDYGGCRKAADAFLAREKSFRIIRKKPSAVLVRR